MALGSIWWIYWAGAHSQKIQKTLAPTGSNFPHTVTWAYITVNPVSLLCFCTFPPPHPPQILGVGNSGIGASSSDSPPAACRAALALAAARNSKSMAVARAESDGNSPELPWVLRFTFFRLGVSRTGSLFVDLEPCLTVFKVDVVSGNSRASLFASSNVHFSFEGFFFSTFFTFFAFFTLEVLESSDAFSNAACFFFLGTRLVSQLFGLRSASSLVNFARKASAMFARLERMAASKDFWQAWATSEVEKCQENRANWEWNLGLRVKKDLFFLGHPDFFFDVKCC